MEAYKRLIEIRRKCDFFKTTTPEEFVFHSNYTLKDFKSKNRKGDIMYDRHILMVLIYSRNESLSVTGRRLERDHSTVINSVETVYFAVNNSFDKLQKRIEKYMQKKEQRGDTPKISLSGLSLNREILKQGLNKKLK